MLLMFAAAAAGRAARFSYGLMENTRGIERSGV
jgi:hypothetical protein